MQVKLLTLDSRKPTRGSEQSAGHDLYSAVDEVVPARGQAVISIGISISLPDETYGRIAPRSGLAVKNSLDIGAGVVDSDYRGPIGVVVFNHGNEDYQVRKGERIAQLIVTKIVSQDFTVVDVLDSSERGSGGFGSTGRM